MSETAGPDDGLDNPEGRSLATSSTGPQTEVVRAITAYADVKAALRDWTVFSSDFIGELDVRAYRQYPLEADPPTHTDYRAVIAPWFHRQRVAELDGPIRAIAVNLVAKLATAGHAEAIHELALPMVVQSLGVAFGRPQDVDEWLSWGPRIFDIDGRRDGRRLDAYLARVFDEVERRPREDIFSHLASSTFQGRPLTRLEKLGFASLVLAGGRDTVVNLIGAAIWRLASHEDERSRLAADPSLLPTALDELLRYLSPLPHMERKLTRTADGYPSGSQVALSFLSANHDPSEFSDPGAIDLSRRPNHHLAFGNGPHTCLGAHLGKLEARVFLEELLAVAPHFSLSDDPEIAWQPVGDSEVPQEFVSLPIALVR